MKAHRSISKRCTAAPPLSWNDASDGHPRSWHIDVEESALAGELDFLRKQISSYDVELLCTEITSLDRYSTRV